MEDRRELLARLHLDPELGGGPRLCDVERQLPMRIPDPFVDRMRAGDATDPLLLQVLPQEVEAAVAHGYRPDPLFEGASVDGQGLLRRFRGRALMVVTGRCAVHCRYCFRRHFPYPDGVVDWGPAVAAIAGDTSLDEVILSGGDPLTVADDRLAELARALAAVPHLRRLRVHTRLPIVQPSRVVDPLVSWLTSTRLQPVVVVHVNHPDEVDVACRGALRRLSGAGITLLNQSVLLAGVNDDADTVCRLSRTLFEAGVVPYYLHMLDRVQGAAHFEVGDAAAVRLFREVAARLPGYLVPRLVRERPGAPYKLPMV
jgi:EF-P beta-lysylation protein EpmB